MRTFFLIDINIRYFLIDSNFDINDFHKITKSTTYYTYLKLVHEKIILPHLPKIKNLILSYSVKVVFIIFGIIKCFCTVEEYKNDANKGKPTIKNITLNEVKELFLCELRFEGLADKNVLFLDWDLWHKSNS